MKKERITALFESLLRVTCVYGADISESVLRVTCVFGADLFPLR